MGEGFWGMPYIICDIIYFGIVSRIPYHIAQPCCTVEEVPVK